MGAEVFWVGALHMKILFVMNPKAGTKKAQKYLADILGEFCGAGHTVITHVTAGPGDAIQAVIRYSKEVDLVVCCGGDGTFNETVNGIMQCGIHVPIGYIPAGSTNDFAASLKLPTQPIKAARAILEGKPVRYDIGQFGSRYFSYVASFGAFTKASYATPQSVKNTLGHTAYILEGIQELSQIRPIHVKLELDEEVIEDDFLFGAISNSTSVGGILTLDPQQVDMQDGKFEILLVRAPRKMGEISECIQALSTQRYNCQMITFRSSSHVRVTADENMVWTLDGERAEGASILDIYNLKQAIRLMKRG
jgi:YegS/Rv2252/BmrU family lipid kinase